MTRRLRIVAGGGLALVLGGGLAVVALRPSGGPPPVPGGRPAGPGPGATSAEPRLVTNEYAYRHGEDPDAVRSPDWIVTSGSLYAAGNVLWSGHPDDRSPGPDSAHGTDSAVLRAVSTRADHDEVRVSFDMRVEGLVRTSRTPPKDTDGVHVLLRYQSELSTYAVSVFRRDGLLAVKKKVPGGPSNGGTYFTLAESPAQSPGAATAQSPGAAPAGAGWRRVEAEISGAGPGSARLSLRLDGRPVIDVVDTGAAAPVLASPGRVGLRGDNCEFYVRDFRVAPPGTSRPER